MAELNPLFLSTGSITQMTSSLNTVIDYIHFPLSQSESSRIFTTNLPDPYLFASQSQIISITTSTTSSSLYQYNIPNRAEKYFYSSDSIIGVSTSDLTVGARIGLQRSQFANTAFNIRSPITLTSFTFACVTVSSATVFVLPAGHAAANTIYPTHIKGLTSNTLTSTTSNISNVYLIQPEIDVAGGVNAATGSIFFNQFAGYSSSFAPTSSIPIYLDLGSLKAVSGSDTIAPSFIPPTSSLWLSQSLATNVVNTSNSTYATVFTLTGLTTGQRYLVNLYMIGSSAVATVGFRMQVALGSEYRGTLWTPTSTTAPAISNSADSNNITSNIATSWPVANGKYLIHGEYTFVKGATDPQVNIVSEGNGTAVTAFSGSVIFYRPIS
jgi:hypothetical protein